MIKTRLTLPQIGTIAGTRGALGAGLGLLLGGKLNKEQRRALGWMLVLVGAISTIPLLRMALNSAEAESASDSNWLTPAPHDADKPVPVHS
jgi:hypothetical protein